MRAAGYCDPGGTTGFLRRVARTAAGRAQRSTRAGDRRLVSVGDVEGVEADAENGARHGPVEAPAEILRRNGSASMLRRSGCSTAPQTASPALQIDATIVRGNRKSHRPGRRPTRYGVALEVTSCVRNMVRRRLQWRRSDAVYGP